jgi:hypothetical protein
MVRKVSEGLRIAFAILSATLRSLRLNIELYFKIILALQKAQSQIPISIYHIIPAYI